ncbi:MAG TPA: hypothetical protein VF837_05315 [Patescibacteria group bacterium]
MENNKPEVLEYRAEYVMTDWTPNQAAAVVLAATEVGYKVTFNKVGESGWSIVLTGKADNVKFNSRILELLVK